MTALIELRDRIQSTQALIAQYEVALAGAGFDPPRSLIINIRSLEKLRRKLDLEYLEVAAQLELEVYRYRIIPDVERVTLTAIADGWAKFQEFFSAVYAALQKSPSIKRKGPEPQRIELGYGYSYAGSIGVVVTVPKDVGFYATS